MIDLLIRIEDKNLDYAPRHGFIKVSELDFGLLLPITISGCDFEKGTDEFEVECYGEITGLSKEDGELQVLIEFEGIEPADLFTLPKDMYVRFSVK
ncbi:MAG: hypothetical protein WCL34_14465 [Methylococcaceae bacterium]